MGPYYSFFIFFTFITSIAGASDVTLSEIFHKGSLHMENMSQADTRLNLALEKRKQATGAVLPRLTARGSYQEIDPPETSGNSPRGLVRTNQYSGLINLSQPLFRGMKEYSAIRQGRALVTGENLLKEAVNITLYREAIAIFFNSLLYERDLASLNELKKATEERVQVLRGRAQIGRSRKGEVTVAEAQVMNVNSQLLEANRLYTANLEQLQFFTGESFQNKKFQSEESTDSLLKELEFYLSRAKERADIKAHSYQQTVAEESIAQSKGNHLPSLDLNANYYLTRTGILETSKWDVALAVSIPLFEGGTTQSQVREAVEKKRELALIQQQEWRRLELRIKQLYQTSIQTSAQVLELKKAVKKLHESYLENVRDYNLGLVTNLEVLQSLNTFIETKRNLTRVETNQQMNLKNLECEAGILPSWDSLKSR